MTCNAQYNAAYDDAVQFALQWPELNTIQYDKRAKQATAHEKQ